jgi:hypothetical protein
VRNLSKSEGMIKVLALMDKESMNKLKVAMLEAETVGKLAAIIIDYTHEEIMLVFDELEWEQQARIKDIWKSV